MDFETSTEKTEDGHTLLRNKHTNEPIAVIKNAGMYKRNQVVAAWHPDFKLVHPEVAENLLHRNIGNKPMDNLATAKSQIGHMAENIVKGNIDHDPVKTTYTGSEEIDSPYGRQKQHKYDIHDDDGNHIGHLVSRDGPNDIHPSNSTVEARLNKNYLDHHNISQSIIDAANKKHSSDNLVSSMKRVRYILDNKNKEPRFVGSETASAPKTEIYKHKMDPSAASSAYEEALKKNAEKGNENSADKIKPIITRHSPTAFTMHVPPSDSKYSKGQTHTVMSLPGEIHHTYYETAHPDYEHKKTNPNIIESA